MLLCAVNVKGITNSLFAWKRDPWLAWPIKHKLTMTIRMAKRCGRFIKSSFNFSVTRVALIVFPLLVSDFGLPLAIDEAFGRDLDLGFVGNRGVF